MNDTKDSGSYRAFCAYGPHYAEPGCGWEAVVDSEAEAERLAKNHSKFQTHSADYERLGDGKLIADGGGAIYQYCVEPGCGYTERWEGGSAADDPAIEHLKENPDHTVRSGCHIGHLRLMKLQEQGKMDHGRDVVPDDWRGENPPVELREAEQ